jgi:3-oxoacyl-[acyl-carrier protein] reductase
MIKIQGKVALVTGGSRGIGRAIVLKFARYGCGVAIHYKEAEEAAAQVKSSAEVCGIKAGCYCADLGNKTHVDNMIERVVRDLGQIDILVNNAGIWKYNPVDTTTETRVQETLSINLAGSFYTIMKTVPFMKNQKSGIIINIASTAGQRGEPGYSPYAASKGAVIAMTKSLAVELAEYNIRVNCVAPGWVETDMTREVLESSEADTVLKKIPLGRVAVPDEIAGPVLFLASDMATFITGEILNVNGGAVLCG